MNTILIGITGRMESGKSSAASALVDRGDFQVVSFAMPLKEMAATLLMSGFGYSRLVVDYHLGNKNKALPYVGVTMRHLLQTLGTDWGRNMIGPDLWVRSARERVVNLHKTTHVVVDDVRFEDEAAMIREAGGLVIHLRRERRLDYGLSHVSEAGISVGAKDVVIDNNGSIEDLREAVLWEVLRFMVGGDELLRLCLTPCADYRA
jgi:hypothetical protein